VCLHSGTVFLSVAVLMTVWIVMLERVFMPAALFRGLLVRGSVFRVGG
ncbi:hypothetical protein A2U01_0083509, partial [Trifolium medium]|nr:hypothetical protein [Trifolium medium]